MRSRLPDGVKLDDDPHDLAVVLIADEQASVLRRHYSLTKLQEILPVEFRPVAGHWYGTYGFPGEKSESYSIDGEMFTRYEDAFAGSEPVQRVPPEIASRSGLAQLVVKYRRKASFGRGLERRRAPDPHGMSGGGMWLLTRNIGLAKWWDESQVRLAAIMIEYHEALGCLVGTPAIEVVRFVYTFEPSLQSVIDATFPFIKSMPAGYRGATIPPNFPRPGSRRA
jgi:hypothetical protein